VSGWPKGWQVLPLEVCMSAIIDYRGKSPEKTTFGVPLVTAKIVKSGRIETPNEFIAEKDYDEWMRRGLPEPGDVVMTTEAPLGEIAQLDDRKIALAQRLITLRGKPRLLDNTYLKFLMQSEFVQEQLKGRATGTTVLGIRQSELRKVSLVLPTYFEQRTIASVLGALDDKIELNRRMNETLEALARALFQNWFVDASQAGLPKGWREGKASDLATIGRAGVNPGEFPDETFDHYSIPAFDEGRTPKPETGDTIKSNKFIVSPDCVLVSKLNPRIPRVWLPDLRGTNRAICSTEFLVTTPKPGVSREFLFCLFTNESFVSVFTTMVTGTSGSHQRVKPESLLGMDTVIPPQSVIQSFTESTAPLLKRINHNIAESRTLAALRGALLPKLLSGALRVPAAAKLVEAHA
jgi:type I restriction enzyme, S subunit